MKQPQPSLTTTAVFALAASAPAQILEAKSMAADGGAGDGNGSFVALSPGWAFCAAPFDDDGQIALAAAVPAAPRAPPRLPVAGEVLLRARPLRVPASAVALLDALPPGLFEGFRRDRAPPALRLRDHVRPAVLLIDLGL